MVDGNVFRVLSRVFGESIEINSPAGKKFFFTLATKLIHQKDPDIYNQALMEFGAIWCTPRLPRCSDCIFSNHCVAKKKDLQHLLPVKIKNKKSKKRYFYYFVVRRGDSLLMKKRGPGDIWQGLFDFYLVEKAKPVKAEKILDEISFSRTGTGAGFEIETYHTYKHVLSHQTIISTFAVLAEELDVSILEDENMKYYTLRKISDLPKPVLISRFLEDYNFL